MLSRLASCRARPSGVAGAHSDRRLASPPFILVTSGFQAGAVTRRRSQSGTRLSERVYVCLLGLRL